MNAAHWHLVLNHIPVLGIFFAAAFLVAGIFGNSQPIKRAGLVLIIFSALAVVPTIATGEEAEHMVEKPGVSHKIIHEHEEVAETAQWLMYGLGVVALLAFLADYRKAGIANALVFICLIASVAMGIVLVNVATSGGQISHPEIHAQLNE